MELTFLNFAAGIEFVLVSSIISIGGGTCKFAPEAGKARMRTAFFTRVITGRFSLNDPSQEPRQQLKSHLLDRRRGTLRCLDKPLVV